MPVLTINAIDSAVISKDSSSVWPPNTGPNLTRPAIITTKKTLNSGFSRSVGLFKFDTSSIPAGAVITEVRFRFYVNNRQSSDGLDFFAEWYIDNFTTSAYTDTPSSSALAFPINSVSYDTWQSKELTSPTKINKTGVTVLRTHVSGTGQPYNINYLEISSHTEVNKPQLIITYMNPPTLTLTSPSNNQTLTEGKTYSIGGTATDPDNDDVVTIKYRINNGTARAINSGVSDGSTPIPFTKTLTYRNKRLWDGSTDVVGYDLAEGTNHTLYVWAEDDKGGKSPDTTRTFTVTWNRPPVISGQDIDLGTINTPPSESFSVTDPEGNPFTIEYYLDNVLFDSFAGVDGQTYTVSLTPDQWIRTSLAQHQLKVRAVDNQGAYSDRIFTFTRTDDRIEFTLNYSNDNVKNFFTTNQKANRILVTMDAVIPTGAVLLVEACNNAYDDQPTWEDITSQVLAKRGYIFTNSTSASGKWGINVRFKITKGTATETVLFNGFGGAFD